MLQSTGWWQGYDELGSQMGLPAGVDVQAALEEMENRSATTATTAGNKGGGVKQAQTYYSTYKKCNHVQDPFPIKGGFKLLLTGGHDLMKPDLSPTKFTEAGLVLPDFGVYLDNGWKYKLETDPPGLPARPSSPSLPNKPLIETFGGMEADIDLTEVLAEYQQELAEYEEEKAAYEKALARWEKKKEARDKMPKTYLWPFSLVSWPDRGIIPVQMAERLINFMREQLHAGKLMDVGCAGAHGRTGTLLAMLLIDEEDLHPAKAIEEVRARHCNKAIESDSQVRLIFGYGGLIATKEEVKKYG